MTTPVLKSLPVNCPSYKVALEAYWMSKRILMVPTYSEMLRLSKESALLTKESKSLQASLEPKSALLIFKEVIVPMITEFIRDSRMNYV